MKQDAWLRCHVRMSEFFGGSAPCIVPDNLKVGVTKHPREGEVVLNDAYQQMIAHYSAAPSLGVAAEVVSDAVHLALDGFFSLACTGDLHGKFSFAFMVRRRLSGRRCFAALQSDYRLIILSIAMHGP